MKRSLYIVFLLLMRILLPASAQTVAEVVCCDSAVSLQYDDQNNGTSLDYAYTYNGKNQLTDYYVIY